jgi:hypothetical protein
MTRIFSYPTSLNFADLSMQYSLIQNCKNHIWRHLCY